MKRKLFDSLNEKQQRLYLGELAEEYGYGGITKVAAEYGASRARVSRRMREYQDGESYQRGESVRRAGGGWKKKTDIYPHFWDTTITSVALCGWYPFFEFSDFKDTI